MSDYPPFIKRIIFLIFGLFISNLLFSCADSTPELAGNRVFMIFINILSDKDPSELFYNYN